MKISLFFLLTIAISTSGCITTSQTTKDIASTIIDTAKNLHNRHNETIDAYIKSLEAAKGDTKSLLISIKSDRDNAKRLKQQILALQAEVMVSKAVTQYQSQAQAKIFSRLDDKIESDFWPPITAKQKIYRDKADELGKDIKTHPCSTNNMGCTSISATNFNIIQKKYRHYSVAAEYILHLGYEQETLIWQKAIESYQQLTEEIDAKVLSFLAKQPNEINISTNSLVNELTQIDSNFDKTITQLKSEKAQINQQWSSTKNAMQQLQNEIYKPAIWKLILNGASAQTRGILAGYSGKINKAVSGVFGSNIGKIVSDKYEEKIKEIADKGFEKLESTVGNAMDDAINKATKKVDAFNNSSNSTAQ